MEDLENNKGRLVLSTSLAVIFFLSMVSSVSAEYTQDISGEYPEIIYREDSNGDLAQYSKGGSETRITKVYATVFAEAQTGGMEIVSRDQNSPYVSIYSRAGTNVGDLTGSYDKPKSGSVLATCEINTDSNTLTDVMFRNQNGQLAYIDGERSAQLSIPNFKEPVGCADFDVDGYEEIVYVGPSYYLRWYNYEPEDSEQGTSGSYTGETVTKNNFGTIVYQDRDSRPEVIYPKEGTGLKAVDHTGESQVISSEITSFSLSAGRSVASTHWDGDSEIEHIVSESSSNDLFLLNDGTATDLGIDAYGGPDLHSYIPPEIENLSTDRKIYGIGDQAFIQFEAYDAEGYTDVVNSLTSVSLEGPDSSYDVSVSRTDSGAPQDLSKNFSGLWQVQGSSGTFNYTAKVEDEKGAGSYREGSFKVDLERPQLLEKAQEKNSVEPGSENRLSVKLSDSMNLSEAVLSTNETGEFTNISVKDFSSGVSEAWANFSWSNSSLENSTVAWKVFFSDVAGNNEVTSVKTFRTKALLDVNISAGGEGSVSFFDSEGKSVGAGNSASLIQNNLYDYRVSSSTSLGDLVATTRSVNVSQQMDMKTQTVESYGGERPESTGLVTPVYAQEELQVEKGNTTLQIPKNGSSPNSIVHCTDWSFQASDCGSWEIDSKDSYEYSENSSYINFNVTGFDAFAAGSTGPIPNVTQLSIYDVTGQQDRKTGGKLVDQGLDVDFNISQEEVNRSYRFTFRIENDGLENWSIEASDELFQDNLSNNWSVGEIWYNLPTKNYTGGDFSSGTVSWDTGNGGVLDYKDGNDTMNASYVVNVTQKSSEAFDQRFEVNDTSEEAGSYQEYILDLKKFGFLEVNLTEPPADTTVQKDSFFVMNATVNCIEGECGKVNISPRYNESSEADTVMPESTSSPFYVSGINEAVCNSEKSLRDACSYSWDVNASGSLDSQHLLDVNASSSFSEVSANDSSDKMVRINNAVRINVTWNSIDFGVLNPGATEEPAQNNSEGYNITVPENSLQVDDLWVRSENMTTDGWKNPSTNESYVIPAKNIFYSLNSFVDTKEPLTNNYQHVISDLSPGSTVTTQYWMNVPEGIKSSKYNGTIYFKANATN